MHELFVEFVRLDSILLVSEIRSHVLKVKF